MMNVRHNAHATIAPVVNPNVKRSPNPNPNPNANPYLNPYPTPNLKKPNDHPHSNSLHPEISSQEQLSQEQISDHRHDKHTPCVIMGACDGCDVCYFLM